MGDFSEEYPKAIRRYSPEGLEHLKPAQIMTSSEMQKEFRVGGLTPSGFVGRCARQGRALKVYRCSRGVNHYHFGEIVAKAAAQNLIISPAPKESAKSESTPITSASIDDPLRVPDFARQLTGRSLRSGRDIATLAYKAGSIDNVSGVYFLVGNGKVVYVGQSKNVYSRVAAHQKTKTFEAWCYVQCSGEKEMDMLESLYIHHLQPEQNGRIGGTDQISVPLDLKTILKAAAEVA